MDVSITPLGSRSRMGPSPDKVAPFRPVLRHLEEKPEPSTITGKKQQSDHCFAPRLPLQPSNTKQGRGGSVCLLKRVGQVGTSQWATQGKTFPSPGHIPIAPEPKEWPSPPWLKIPAMRLLPQVTCSVHPLDEPLDADTRKGSGLFDNEKLTAEQLLPPKPVWPCGLCIGGSCSACSEPIFLRGGKQNS